jgi:hypothetical protein
MRPFWVSGGLLWPDLLPETFHVSALIDTLCFHSPRFIPVASPAYCRAGQVSTRNEIGIRILPTPNTNPLRRGETMSRFEAPSTTCTHFADIHASIHAPPLARKSSCRVKIVLATCLAVPNSRAICPDLARRLLGESVMCPKKSQKSGQPHCVTHVIPFLKAANQDRRYHTR